MKAISLWQPWAALVALGAKQYETRSWSTAYRGPLVIHAAKTTAHLDVCFEPYFLLALVKSPDFCQEKRGLNSVEQSLDPKRLPFGAFVAVVNLVEIQATEKVRDTLSKQERAFGDYSDGRFAWKLEDVRVFPEPVPARGYQGLWDPLKGASEPMRRTIDRLYGG